jgi:hypothetical protein
MGLFKKGFSGFDRRTTDGKALGEVADVARVAGKGALLVGKGAYLAGKFVAGKVKEGEAKREEKIAEIKNQLQGLREEDPSGYIKSGQWALLVRELLEVDRMDTRQKEEIKNQLKEIRDQDPSGYIKIKRFWYSAEKNLNKYFDKQVEEHLKEEHPELFDKFFKKLKWTYFWCNFEKITEKYKEKVAEEILKIEDPEAYKSVLFRKKIKLALLLTSAILIVVGISMFSIQECSFDKITDGSAKTPNATELNCKSPLF